MSQLFGRHIAYLIFVQLLCKKQLHFNFHQDNENLRVFVFWTKYWTKMRPSNDWARIQSLYLDIELLVHRKAELIIKTEHVNCIEVNCWLPRSFSIKVEQTYLFATNCIYCKPRVFSTLLMENSCPVLLQIYCTYYARRLYLLILYISK